MGFLKKSKVQFALPISLQIFISESMRLKIKYFEPNQETTDSNIREPGSKVIFNPGMKGDPCGFNRRQSSWVVA
jgi:hypothetical protein